MSRIRKTNNQEIVFACGIFPPDIGGPATYVAKLAPALRKRGIKVKILAYANQSGERVIDLDGSKIDFYQVSRQWPLAIRYFIFFWKLFKLSFYSTAVFAQDSISSGLPAWLVCFLLRKRLVIKVVGDFAWETAGSFWGIADSIDDFQKKRYGWKIQILRKIQSFVLRKTVAIITPSIYLKKMVAGWGIDAAKIKVIYNAVEEFKFLPLGREKAQELIGIKGKIILSVGRLSPWKGFDGLIKLMPALICSDNSIKLVIAGQGEDEAKLRKIINDLRMKQNVFLVGAIEHSQMPLYYQASDLLVLNSGYEGLSHTLLEGLRFGLPIVATNVGGNPEVISDGVEGFLTPCFDQQKLANAILKILQDEPLREQMVQKAKIKSQNFLWENLLKQTYETFND